MKRRGPVPDGGLFWNRNAGGAIRVDRGGAGGVEKE
jgi:hypothetical protein